MRDAGMLDKVLEMRQSLMDLYGRQMHKTAEAEQRLQKVEQRFLRWKGNQVGLKQCQADLLRYRARSDFLSHHLTTVS